MPKSPKRKSYHYTPLIGLRPHSIVDVYGIVIFYKLPVKTKGTDYMKIITIVDKSLITRGQKLKCLIFERDERFLPEVKIGSIVRFHRLRINKHNGELQGVTGRGFSWLVGDYHNEGPANLVSSHDNYTFTSFDKKKIQELRDLALEEGISFQNKLKSLDQLQEGIYFDFLCQVVAVGPVDENTCVLVQAWDGTLPTNPISSVKKSKMNLLTDPRLNKISKKWLVDILAYKDHYDSASALKPGMFIKFCNLHCPKTNNEVVSCDASKSEELELVLYGGNSYGRGIKILDDSDKDVQRMNERLANLYSPVKAVTPERRTSPRKSVTKSTTTKTTDTAARKRRSSTTTNKPSTSTSTSTSEVPEESASDPATAKKTSEGVVDAQTSPVVERKSIGSTTIVTRNRRSTATNNGTSSSTPDAIIDNIRTKVGTLDIDAGPVMKRKSVRSSTIVTRTRVPAATNIQPPSSTSDDFTVSTSLSTPWNTSQDIKTEVGAVDKEPGPVVKNKSVIYTSTAANNRPSTSAAKILILSASDLAAGKISDDIRQNIRILDARSSPMVGQKSIESTTTATDHGPSTSSSEVPVVSASNLATQRTSGDGKPNIRVVDTRSYFMVGRKSNEPATTVTHNTPTTSSPENVKTQELTPLKTPDEGVFDVAPGSSGEYKSVRSFATATLHRNHFTDLTEVMTTKAPMKFRILARIIDYSPKLTSVTEFLSLYCPKCKYLSPLKSFPMEERMFVTHNSVQYYQCPQCNKEPTNVTRPLDYIFLLKFLLSDGIRYIICNLWKEEAVKFFCSLTPLEFINKPGVVKKVQSLLDKIHPGNIQQHQEYPLLDCCIKSYHGQGQSNPVCYQMFDTIIVER
ncbi:protection of telomeres protein 1-like [Argonauta hians]